MIDLKDTNVILTGATGGIGNSILENLILTGANVLATGTNEDKLYSIKEKYNVTAIFHCAVLYKSADWVNKNQADVSYYNNIINLNILKNSQLFFLSRIL